MIDGFGEDEINPPGPLLQGGNGCASPRLGSIKWVGKASHRIVVNVDHRPVTSKTHPIDVAPASAYLDFKELFGFRCPLDLGTLQIMQLDTVTGEPIEQCGFDGALSLFDLPFRFDFDDFSSAKFNHWFNIPGKSVSGNLVWSHVQTGDQASYYAVYVDEVVDDEQQSIPPRPVIGDCDAIYREHGGLIPGLVTSAQLVDFGGDGHYEMLFAFYNGQILRYWNSDGSPLPPYENRGFVMADGDVMYQPFAKLYVVDWNDDGKLDILLGTEGGGKLFWYENVSENSQKAVFESRGQVLDKDGMPITTPASPCKEIPDYKYDYSPFAQVCDWDGDGRDDLLLGGYVTGMIFHYRNIGRNQDGTPVLEYAGTLEADGEVLDVTWAASPTAFDFRDCGLLDIVCGSQMTRPNGGLDIDAPALHYFKNIGSKNCPRLTEVPFPVKESDIIRGIAQPRAVDWDNDGRMDLIVSTDKIIFLRNIGTNQEPCFEKAYVMESEWEHAYLGSVIGAVDMDGIGAFSIISNSESGSPSFARRQSGINPPMFAPAEPLKTADGQLIYHPSLTGDDYTSSILYDWRNSGVVDLFVGDSQGHLFYYRNDGSNENMLFASGEQPKISDGSFLKVGKQTKDVLKDGNDWGSHAGTRTTLAAADMNGDGISDLVIGYVVDDVDGYVEYFENVGSNESPLFAEGRILLKDCGRTFVTVTDWNNDGLPDIIAGWGTSLFFCPNSGSLENPQFGEKIPINLPVNIYYACPSVCDFDNDGSDDLLIGGSYGYAYLLDRTFSELGYAAAEIVCCDVRNPNHLH